MGGQRAGGVALTAVRAGLALAVLAIVVKAVAGRVGAFDLGFDDECWILDHALHLPEWPLPPPEWGPLYAVWYRGLGAFEPDPTRLYTVNWVVLQLALSTLLFALARRSGAPRWAASAVTVGWVVSRAVTVWPFAVYFSTSILALGALAATYARDRLAALGALAVATSVASFVRPELAVPGIPLAGVAIAWSLVRAARSRSPRALGVAVAVAAIVGALVVVCGSPLGGGRSWFAFEQHYAWHRVEAEHLDVDPMTAYEPIVRRDFPLATSIAGAARENPAAFAWHVGRNARLVLVRLAWFLGADDYVPRALAIPIELMAVGALLCGAVALCLRRRSLPRGLVAWAPIGLPVGASFTAAAVLIHPRDHYLVSFAFFAVASLASAVGAFPAPSGTVAHVGRRVGLVAALLLLAALPTYRRDALPSLTSASGAPPPTEWQARNTVAALRALGLPGERVVLEAEFSHAAYAQLPCRRVPLEKKDRPFAALLRDEDVDLVVITPRLENDARFRDDPEFRSFVAPDGDHRGFLLVPVPRATTWIAHRPR